MQQSIIPQPVNDQPVSASRPILALGAGTPGRRIALMATEGIPPAE